MKNINIINILPDYRLDQERREPFSQSADEQTVAGLVKLL